MDVSKTMGLLKAALDNAGNDPALSEARSYIRQAITKLEHVSRRKEKGPTQSQQWWDKIIAGTAQSPTTPQAGARSLKELDAMISAEQKKINELEKSVQDKTKSPGLLQD
jgi:flagellar biosynthesis chaperone FliJ